MDLVPKKVFLTLKNPNVLAVKPAYFCTQLWNFTCKTSRAGCQYSKPLRYQPK